jgi:transcriptional regulator
VKELFKEIRSEEIERIIHDYPLASIVVNTASGLYATHVPLMFKQDQTLFGHIALENQLYTHATEGQEVLCIFKGEDTYVSANDYPSKFVDHRKVPTWNYQVVHVHGKIKFLTDTKIKLAALGRLTKSMEEKTNGNAAWKMSDAPKDYLMEMLEKIVVLEIEISRIEALSKLSQNREKKDFDGVIDALSQRGENQMVESMLRLNRE